MTYRKPQWNRLCAPFPEPDGSAAEAREAIGTAVGLWIRKRFNRIPTTVFEAAVSGVDEWYDPFIWIPDTQYREWFNEFLSDEEYSPVITEDDECFVRDAGGEMVRLCSTDEFNSELRSGGFFWLTNFEDRFYEFRGSAYPTFGYLYEFDSDYGWSAADLEAAASAGFKILWNEDSDVVLGPMLGINGGGYNFFDAHWIPLFLSRDTEWAAVAAHWDLKYPR